MKTRITILASLLLGVASLAQAEPLTLSEIDRMAVYLECRAICESGSPADLEDCLAGCPAEDSNWEKNLRDPLDDVDEQLAALEYWDEGTLVYICYEEGAVVPRPLCGAGDCLDEHTPEECADADGDGIAAWIEDLIGTSDQVPDTFCSDDADCGFSTACTYVYELNDTICLPRDCVAGGCTAFHLETVAVDNQELIIHLHYDYSPVPATVLDLYIEYDHDAITLLDARPLPLLVQWNKELATSHTEDGKLRLVVLGAGSTIPIPTGAIVELVFRRVSSSQTTVGFTSDDWKQSHSMAPHQGDGQDELQDDRLWGDQVQVGAAAPNGPRMFLYYSFDNPSAPLDYSDVLDGEGMCSAAAECSQEENERERTRWKSMVEIMQRGAVQVSQLIEGVSGPGVYLDGAHDHLQMPVTLNTPYLAGEQSFSLSTWFYAESAGVDGQPQLLFSHNASASERTRFGLMLEPAGPDAVDLVWFEGDLKYLDGMHRHVVAEAMPVRTWAHLGMSLDASTGEVRFFVNGEPVPQAASIQNGQEAIQCPGFNQGGSGLILHKEGDIGGGRGSEVLFYASAENNLYGVEQMDLHGMTRSEIVRDGEHTFQDPDYSPLMDKIVYSSNVSGDFEIWIADGDGSDPRQITHGFGDTARGIFARRPCWAPDASAIVFESNAYDVLEGDNLFARGYHLYYIEYDNASNQVTTELDYPNLLVSQTIADFRLTLADRNHNNAVWLSGATHGTDRGEILFNTSDEQRDDRVIHSLVIPININQSSPEELDVPGVDQTSELRMLTAFRRRQAGQDEVSKMLFAEIWASYEVADQFQQATTGTNTVTLAISHNPSGYDSMCWDTDRDQVCDSDENQDGLGECDVADCYPFDVRNLYIRYDPQNCTPDLAASLPGAGLETKELELKEIFTSGGSYVRVEVLSPIDDLPIPAGAELALVVFACEQANGDFALVKRQFNEELYMYINNLTTDDQSLLQFTVAAGHLEQILDAAFSPDGLRLVLSGIQNARPVLIRTENILTTSGSEKISLLPMRIKGLSWVKLERFYPCNWMGAFRDPFTKTYVSALRGGLDELKLHSYVRSEATYRSEAQRGLERLRLEGREGQVDSLLPTCTGSDFECPPYHLCESGQCVLVPCDWSDPYGCERGQCTLLPASVGQGEGDLEWVCSVECNYDRECFGQECLNGPCRFCGDQTMSCIECRPTEEDYGAFQIRSIEGCPDRNSFACEEGSCITECYTFEDGQSRYLCDPAVEYCKQGRCVLFDWDWTDFAPASFGGLGETWYDLPGLTHTVAISQLHPIKITAYGVEDYLHPPELLVEGKVTTQGAQVYGDDWFEIGRILVYNKTRTQATSNPYLLQVPYQITDLRMRLILPPYQNMNAAATGLMGKDKDFCHAAAEAWAESQGLPVDYSPCIHRAPGSRFWLGYRAGIPMYEAYLACQEHGGAGCQHDENDVRRPYLYGGHHAVIINEVEVADASVMNSITINKICSYEGTHEPSNADGTPKKMFFGDISLEQSNQKEVYCQSHADECSQHSSLLDFTEYSGGNWALLNCNYASPGELAVVEFGPIYITQAIEDGIITETANSCIMGNEPCFEWIGSDASLDIMNAESQAYHTLDFDLFRSFGYDAEDQQAAR